MQNADLSNLYDIIWDAIDAGGSFSYAEVIGVLEVIKSELLEELKTIIDDESDISE